MPIYEYQCGACGHKMEILQKITDDVLQDCPACQQKSLQKLISAGAFELKGTGWYKTDFRNTGKPPEKPGKSDTTESSKTENKKDSKDSKDSVTTTETK